MMNEEQARNIERQNARDTLEYFERLQALLRHLGKVTVAVSGGVDSMTLAYVANQTLGQNALIVHSLSAAVPTKDTLRIRAFADAFGWNMSFVNSGELDNPEYRQNPVNRCYYCKSCLYTTLTALKSGTVVSGTNLDDLDDYRPGLIAATENKVRHPFVEAGIDKTMIRAIAAERGLHELSELPASPCLSSRIETGIHIQEGQLSLVNEVEDALKTLISCNTLRCRIQQQQICIEIDDQQYSAMSPDMIMQLKAEVATIVERKTYPSMPITFRAYERGSAFVGAKQ